jgi:hypothetical protein
MDALRSDPANTRIFIVLFLLYPITTNHKVFQGGSEPACIDFHPAQARVFAN